MANEVSIKVSTDSRKAAQDFDHLRSSIKLLDAEARRLGTGFTAGASQAETALGRLQTRMARLRTEIHQTQAASRNLGGGSGRGAAFASGFGGALPGGGALGGGAAGIGAAAGAFVVGAAYTGYNEARAQAQAESFLANAAKQTGQAYAAQASEVAKLRRELGLTTAQATELHAASLRFTGTIGRPQDAGRLSRALANSLAASGRSSSEIPDRLRQLQTGQDELFDVIGPVKIGGTFAGSPEAIYKAYAREILNVKRELTDLEKTQARYYAVLQAGEASVGAAAERMSSSVGQIDKLTNAFKDLTGSIITAIGASEGFKTVAGAAGSVADAAGGSGATRQRILAGAFGISGAGEGLLYGARQVGGAWNYLTEPSSRTAALGPANLASQFARQARLVAETFGISSGGPASALGGPYSGRLDTPTYLNRDPFAWASVAEQNAANAPGILARQRRAFDENRRFAGGIVPGLTSAYGGIVGAGDRLAALGGISGETPQQRAARVFTLSGSVATDAAEAYRIGGYSSTEARAMAEAEARRFRISSLGNVAPGELSADQEAAYREDLKKYQEDQLKQARDTLLEAVRMRKALEKMAGKLAPDDPVEPEPTIIQIDNRSDTTARFATVSGDTLRSDDR